MGLNTGSLASGGRRQGVSIYFIGGLSSLSRESECLNGEVWTYLATMPNVLQGTGEYHFFMCPLGSLMGVQTPLIFQEPRSSACAANKLFELKS